MHRYRDGYCAHNCYTKTHGANYSEHVFISRISLMTEAETRGAFVVRNHRKKS